MPGPLPSDPDLGHLRKEAKALLKELRDGAAGAVQRFAALGLRHEPKLADAQHLIAVEYGFRNWAELKAKVESMTPVAAEVLAQAQRALKEDDAGELRRLLRRHPGLRKLVNQPIADFNSPPILCARSKAMIDVLVEFGGDLDARSTWWAGGFGLLETVPPELAEYAIERGATVSVHAAARLGMLDRLRELLDADPTLVNARGGDGKAPLHYAATVEIAAMLLERGAEIDLVDVDHESTPAQYAVKQRPEVARYLVSRGCRTDLLMASALGDRELAERHLRRDPESIRTRVNDEYFPKSRHNGGGTIYQWELGWHVSAPQVARAFGHTDLYERLMEACPPEERLLNACWLHEEALVRRLIESDPDLASQLTESGKRNLAHAARNRDGEAARLMVLAGIPAGVRGQHYGTPLHWAAWHGDPGLVKLLIERGAELEDAANEFHATPLGWAIHGSQNGWYRDRGDYAATVETMLAAGAKPPEKTGGSPAVRGVLRRRGL